METNCKRIDNMCISQSVRALLKSRRELLIVLTKYRKSLTFPTYWQKYILPGSYYMPQRNGWHHSPVSFPRFNTRLYRYKGAHGRAVFRQNI